MSGPSAGSTDDAPNGQERSDHVEQARARLGRVVLGRWTLTRVLGLGGMAAVYEATHRNGRRAALKILHPTVAALSSARRRFVSEGYAANKVGHPGAVTILDDGEDGDLVFLVMELLSGRSLAQRLTEEGPLPAKDVARVARGMLDVLASAHDRGVVHRDIKPSNVFELESGEIKLLDFGVAQVREPGSLGLTESGVTLGTPAFMAPEQAAGRMDEVDALTDLWAVGATMFQLLTGRYVHDAKTPNAAIVASATQPAPPVRSVKRDVPEDLARVVDRALSFARDARFANARAMRKALEQEPGDRADHASTGAEATTLPEQTPFFEERRKRHLGRDTLVVLGALAVVALGSTLARQSSSGALLREGATPVASPPPAAAPPLRSAGSADAVRAVLREVDPPAELVPTPARSSSAAPPVASARSTPRRPSPITKARAASTEDDALIETRH